MNSNHKQPVPPSQPEIELSAHLTDLAEMLEPDQAFQSDLEAELLRVHPSNLPKSTHRRANRITPRFPRLNRRASIVAGTSIAISAALMIPVLISGRATSWLTAGLTSTINSRANAQTITQAISTGQITLTANAQEYDETTQNVRAIGDASFVYPEAQIHASANEIQYIPTAQEVTLLGDVRVSQRGDTLRGKQATCSLEKRECRLTEK